MAKIYNSPFPGFRKFLEMLRKIGRSIKTRLTKRFASGTVTTSCERGCGQDDEVVRSYCRSGCQGRRRILLRCKLPLYDRHYYGRHYGVHFCCHYFHYWHNSIWLAWGYFCGVIILLEAPNEQRWVDIYKGITECLGFDYRELRKFF